MSEEPTEFGQLLRFYRERAGRSRNSLCKGICDPSYATRCEAGDRDPPRAHIVDAFARELCLTSREWDRLRVSAGYSPVTVEFVGMWDDALADVAEVLSDSQLPPEDRIEFRAVVRAISHRWHNPTEPISDARIAV